MKINEIAHIDETYGKKVFKKSGYKYWLKIYKDIYRTLSAYVHTGAARKNSIEIYDKGFNGSVYAEFDLCKIMKCLEMIKKVVLAEIELMEILLQKVYSIPKDLASYKDIFRDI